MTSENTAPIQPSGKPFAPGQSGNPAGRPRGARNRTTIAVEALLEGQAEALTRKAIEMAMEGNIVALRLCLDRLAPARKDRCIQIDLPEIHGIGDITGAQIRNASVMASGGISPDEAGKISGILEQVGASMERRDLEQRIQAIEANLLEQGR